MRNVKRLPIWIAIGLAVGVALAAGLSILPTIGLWVIAGVAVVIELLLIARRRRS